MPDRIEAALHEAEVQVEFENPREESMIRVAVVGRDAHDFLNTSVGKFVIGAALQDQIEIESKLASLKPNTPWRRRKITELQQQHEAITRAVAWLTDMVVLGQQTQDQLEAERVRE